MRKAALYILALLTAIIIHSCAQIGSPDGGWYDETPPRVVYSSPADKGTNVTDKRVKITFNEYIAIENATSNVIVSPPQIEPIEIETAGKNIIVKLKDTLKENTTYTIDFSDAIVDNNESNPMGNYTFCFSTGDRIDTLEVSGYVLDASDLEPVSSILVGLYDNLSDTVFTSQPMLRVARTDSRGHFVIRGVAPGDYRIYALNDADGDYVYNQMSEMIAFSHDIVSPYCRPDTRQDTLWRDSLRIDSIAVVPYMHYYPDDVTLLAFTPEQTNRYLIKTNREDYRKITFFFSYGNDALPVIEGLDFNADSAFIVETTEKRDTVYYWLRDTVLANRDTLTLAATYLMTDTAGALVSQTDTIEMLAKTPYARRQKAAQEEYEKWQKDQEKAKKRGKEYDSIMPIKHIRPDINIPSRMSPDETITITVPTPIVRLDTQAVHLYVQIDSLWYRSRCELRPTKDQLRKYELLAEWRPGLEYSLEIDSAAFEDTYGMVSDEIITGIQVLSLDYFATLFVNVTGTRDTTLIVQLLNATGKVQKETKPQDGTAEFYYVTPGLYYLAAFEDTNGNGVWDTGDYYSDRQAERVYYNPKSIECKAKWDVTTNWNINATPTVRQKPSQITKQKSDTQKTVKHKNADRAKELGIPYNPDEINQ